MSIALRDRRCGNCRFHREVSAPIVPDHACYRFPTSIPINPKHWCGEWREAEQA